MHVTIPSSFIVDVMTVDVVTILVVVVVVVEIVITIHGLQGPPQSTPSSP